MNIQWFPGHMAKTMKLIKENIKMVDVVIELVDARIPISSKNPDIDELTNTKSKIVILNKADLSDKKINKLWIEYFKSNNIPAILFDSAHSNNANEVLGLINSILQEKIEVLKAKGMSNRSIKLMIVGIPNVGKSSFINKFVKKSVAIAGDRPGVTRGKQWIRIKQGFELLDTPGVLWPKFEDENIGLNLAFVGSIKDEIIDIETLAVHLLDKLNNLYPDRIEERYKINLTSEMNGYEILCAIAKKRGFLISGGELDTLRCANVFFDEFRASKLGAISLETPSDIVNREGNNESIRV